MPKPKLSSEQCAEMARLYATGTVTQSELGRRFGLCAFRVRTYLTKAGIPTRPTTKLSEAQREELKRLYLAGATHLAAHFDVSQDTIAATLKRLGVPMPPRPVAEVKAPALPAKIEWQVETWRPPSGQ